MMAPTTSMSQHQFTQFVHDWDSASKQTRADILREVVEKLSGKIASDIEDYFCSYTSLFFTRITAWLRLSYMNTEHLQVQLEAILMFVSATGGGKFLSEFIEVGGVLTLIEVLGLTRVKEVEKRLVVDILSSIGHSGRKYKELICESFGIRAVAECLAHSHDIHCQTSCRKFLKELATGNPKYEKQLYKAMISLLKCSSPEAQRVAAQLIQYMQPSVGSATISIVDPCLQLLQSPHLEVLYEAFELIKMLVKFGSIREDLLSGLVALLQPFKGGVEEVTFPVYLQQAAAAKVIGVLLDEDKDSMYSFLKFDAIQKLMFAMSNDEHPDSQKQAAITLHAFILLNTEVEQKVRDAMGQALFFQYMNSPDSFFMSAYPIYRDILIANKVKISGVAINDVQVESVASQS